MEAQLLTKIVHMTAVSLLYCLLYFVLLRYLKVYKAISPIQQGESFRCLTALTHDGDCSDRSYFSGDEKL